MRFYRFSKQSLGHYIIVFTAIVFALVIAMGAFVYTNYYRYASGEFSTANYTCASNLRSRHENELQIMEDIATQLSLQPENIGFLLDEKPTLSATLKKQLYMYRSVSQFFDCICYYYQKDDYVWNDKTSMAYDFFAQKACITEGGVDFLKAEYGAITALPLRTISGTLCDHYAAEASSAVYIAPAAPYYDSLLVFFVGESRLSALAETLDGRSAFIIYNGEIIYSKGELGFAGEELLQALNGEEQTRAKLGNEDYMITALSGRSGFAYVVAQPLSLLSSGVLKGAYPALIILLLLTVPAALLLTYIWHSLMRRMTRISTAVNGTAGGADVLSSIESGIGALISGNNQIRLANVLYKKTEFATAFLKSVAGDAKNINALANECGIRLGSFLACVCGTREDSDEDGIYGAVSGYIENSQAVSGCGITLLNGSRRVLLMFADSADDLLNACNDIFAIGRSKAAEFIMALSGIHTDYSEGAAAYLEADTAYSGRFLADNDRPILFKDISGSGSLTASTLPRDSITRLEHAVRTGDEAEAAAAADEFCQRMRRADISLPAFKLIYNELLRIIAGDARYLGGYNIFTLSDCLTLSDLNRLLKDACHEIISGANEKDGGIVSLAMEYMRQSLGDHELTMSLLSEKLGVSSAVLSQKFKSQTDISPSDYLTSLRMNRAKQLLKETDMLVKDVADAVGYEDEHVFMRRFKKYTGQTPGGYRSGAREDGE